MFPAFVVTFREVFEAALVVAMMCGIFVRMGEKKKLVYVWVGVLSAITISIVLVFFGSYVGFVFQNFYSGRNEELIEGILAIITACFVTWAILSLDRQFREYKLKLIQKINYEVQSKHLFGIFMIAFTSVFREGVEIILLLSTILLSTDPTEVMTGFGYGIAVGVAISLLIFTATLKLPVHRIFRISTILLVLFSAGLLAKGVHEFAEYGLIPELMKLHIPFVPVRETIVGSFIYGLFGIRNVMDVLQVVIYALYAYAMMYILKLVPVKK